MTQPLIIDQPWEANRASCPYDFDLADWLAEQPRARAVESNRRVFHMGTGMHHEVGLRVARERMPYSVVGLTCTPDEMAEYMRLAITEPEITHRYTVLFGDIYTLHPERMLPPLDIASLPHLGEFANPKRYEYSAANDENVISRFIHAVQPGGLFITYPGSVGYHLVGDFLQHCCEVGALEEAGQYRSLRLMRKLP